MMKIASRLICCVLLVLLTTSCRRKSEKVREKTFLTVNESVNISNLTVPALVKDSRGNLFMTVFIHSAFPSATEEREAIAVFESTDNGANWKHLADVPSRITYGVWGYDLCIDEKDNLYLTWTSAVYGANSVSPFKAIMFTMSDDSGRSWSEPVYVNSSESGQRNSPQIVVSGENIYIAWLDQSHAKATTIPQDVYIASSHDGGRNWSENQCLEIDLKKKDSSSGAPTICLSSGGTVYCAYFSIRKYDKGAKGGFWIAKSVDKGKTFSVHLNNVGPLGAMSIMEDKGKLYLAAVYIKGIKSLSMRNPETFQEVRLYVSDDGGEKWSRPAIIDDDTSHARKTNMKIISVGSDKILTCWDDGRGGVYAAASVDGGINWGKNVKLAQSSTVGNTPLDIAANMSSENFYLVASDIRKGPGDSTSFVRGRITK